MTALRTTFYSYKGGVGRTLSLLNVGALLAAHGRKVVAVDLDLEAPGFGLSGLTRRLADGPSLGVSDLLQDRLRGGRRDFHEYCYRVLQEELRSDRQEFWLLPAGTVPGWLASIVSELYRDPTSDTAELFLLLLDEIEAALTPDFILFDSRTGRTDIAGVALLDLPQVIVAVAGLNEQNVAGMRDVLEQLRRHPARQEGVLTLLALSPVPTELALASHPRREPVMIDFRDPYPLVETITALSNGDERSRMLLHRIADAQAQLLAPIQSDFVEDIRRRFPELQEPDLYHIFPYDPLVPLTDELQVARVSDLSHAYGRLADVLARARTGDPGLPELSQRAGPLLP
jgi:MinD-like ATPase involved in chromosome partitioning or flagellar assembly